MWNRLRANGDAPKLILVLVLGLLVALVALRSLTPDQALAALMWGGYWLILAAFLIFVWAMKHVLPAWWRERQWSRRDYWCLGVVAMLGVVLLVHEPAGFKVLMDEIQLLGTSMAMHFQRAVFVPQRGNDLNGIFELIGGQIDKRPLFFPFLLSSVHDLTGYRPENAFWLNGILTFVLLGLSYVAGRSLGGRRAGLMAALWWAGLPLLGQNARGGGFELLNVVMIVLTALLAGWHYRRRDDWSLIALVYAGLLLAQTRYESPLFLLAVAGVVLLVWWEERRIRIPWLVLGSPVLLLPVPLLMRIFQVRPQSWEMAEHPGYSHVFSVTNIPSNLGHAFAFWFNFGVEQPNSPLFAACGLLALVIGIAILPRMLRSWREQPPAMRVGIFFAACLFGHLLLLLCYFWGQFDDPVIRRLSLPTHALFILAMIFACRMVRRPERWFGGLALLATGALIVSGLPGLARQAATKLYYPALDVAWRREFMQAFPERDYLFIDNDSSVWITHLVSATPILQARERPEAIAFNLRNRMFSGIYVFQRFDIDEKTGALRVKPDDDLGPAYELQTIAERTWQVDTLSRISRVKAIRLPSGAIVKATPILPGIKPGGGSRDAREKVFLEQWIKNLP